MKQHQQTMPITALIGRRFPMDCRMLVGRFERIGVKLVGFTGGTSTLIWCENEAIQEYFPPIATFIRPREEDSLKTELRGVHMQPKIAHA